MKSKITLLLLVISITVLAQKKSLRYRLPEGIQKSQYSQGSVLVKWKENHNSNNGRLNLSVQGVSISRMNSLAGSVRSWNGPRKSSIDISRYSRIALNKGQDIETVINKLYASGYFEIVEPEFVNKMSLDPNDPSKGQQYYLDLINAYEAWDLTTGSEEVVIAIIDSGGDLDHPDLTANLYSNPDEVAGNDLDDDNDGFIDNVQGWDFVGADTLNVFQTNFIGDNNPQLSPINGIGSLSHGVWVAGCASASTNNSIGIAGVGYKSKLLFTKHTAENQDPQDPGIFFGYDGVLYAAETLTQDNVARKIINCSWGGTFRSQIAQDIINYVTNDLGCLVIGAAGNANSQAPHFPSSYDNVLSVAATTQTDVKASFSNTGYTVDLTAPGVSILSTQYNNIYGTVQGTSFSCPIVSGAAALVWAYRPTLTAVQVAEVLRVSADATIYSKNSSSFADKLGKGRLDIQQALILESPSIRVTNPSLTKEDGGFAEPGLPATLSVDFTNFLSPSTGALTATITSSSPAVIITSNQVNLGIIGENEKITKKFPLTISASAAENLVVNLKFTFSDGTYTDFQVISYNVNPSFADIDENQVTTTITSKGRLGFDDPDNQTKGSGFVFNDNQILYEMGLITGTSSSTIFNNVRGTGGNFDQDFKVFERLREQTPGERSTSEIYGSFQNGTTPATSSVQIDYRSLVRKDAPYDKFVIYEYKVKNISATALNGYRFGIFADWDLSYGGGEDAADWNGARKLGYVYPRGDNQLPHAGIQLLNQPVNYFAIDNNQAIGGNPFGLYDGYTDSEKFTSLSTERLTAGTTTLEGNDVSHVISAGPFNIAAGEIITIAFAVHAANNLTELLESADQADIFYNQALQLAKPEVAIVPTCYGSAATINATGATNFNWYTDFTGGVPVATGSQFITPVLTNDTVFYVANADNAFESIRTKVEIILKAKPYVNASGSLTLCDGQTVSLTAESADTYLWRNGATTHATTQSIDVTTAGNYSVTVRDNSLGCEFTSETEVVTVHPLPTANFTSSSEFISDTPITFTDGSSGAASWLWNFGDNQSSTQQNPNHTFNNGGSFEVTLTITDINGCQDSFSETLDIITDAEKALENAITISPNPTKGNIVVEINGLASPYFNIQILNAQGQSVYAVGTHSSYGNLKHTIPASTLTQGVYFVKIYNGRNIVTRKIIKLE